jgi:integrase
VIWSLFYDAGLRRAEVAGLQVHDVYLGDHPYLQFTGKGGKVRQVAIKQSGAKLLSAWLKVRPGAEDGELITDWNGQGITPGQVWRRFELICAASGVTATPHDLRHTFVYRTVEEAMSRGATRAAAVGIACSQAGHSDSRITEMYLRPTSEFIYQVVEGM